MNFFKILIITISFFVIVMFSSCTIGNNLNSDESESITIYHQTLDIERLHIFKNVDSLFIMSREIDTVKTEIKTTIENYSLFGDYYQLREKTILLNDKQVYNKVYNNSSVKIGKSLSIEDIIQLREY